MSASDRRAGTRIGRYILEKKIAIGGMAEIYLAWSEGPGGFRKRCVIKRIKPDRAKKQHNIDMFLDEARLAARFRHRNLVQVFELEQLDGQYILVMEYLDGVDLEQLLLASKQQEKSVTPAMAAFIAAEVAAGLHHAHELRDASGRSLNLVHRDISPANILLTRQGDVKVVDFGIAKHRHSSTRTQRGVLKGTLLYMSPEQIRSEPLDRRGDLFALGAVLYEMLTLRMCFARDRSIETMAAIANAMYRSFDDLGVDVPASLARIVKRLLQADAAQRYQTAEQVNKDLRQFILDTGVPSSTDLRVLVESRCPRTSTGEPSRIFSGTSGALEGRTDVRDEDEEDTIRVAAYSRADIDEQEGSSELMAGQEDSIPLAEDTLPMRRPSEVSGGEVVAPQPNVLDSVDTIPSDKLDED